MHILPSLLSIVAFISFVGCGQQEAPAVQEPAFSDITPEISALLQRCDVTLDAIGDIRYNVLHSFKSTTSKDTTHNIYTVLLRRDTENPYGYKLFARNAGGYHILYDGVRVYSGDPSTKKMTVRDSSDAPVQWLDRSFASRVRIGMLNGSRLTKRIRQSGTIEGMRLEDTKWENAPAKRLLLKVGSKPPVTGGEVELIFRNSDAMPVSIHEELHFLIDGKEQMQFTSAAFVEIDREPAFPEGQFTRQALPETVELESP